MPFDPNLPIDDSLAEAAELRDQFNGLKALIDALQAQINTLLTPVLVYDKQAERWNIIYAGPMPYQWDIWERNNFTPTWWKLGEKVADTFPAPTESILSGDETWWQVKFIGNDGDGHDVTPFSNVVSSPNAPV